MSEQLETTDDIRRRMSRQARRNTAPEVALRREVHRRGLRFRVEVPVPGLPRRRIDIVFATHPRLAVFVDGCFWHSCPMHSSRPANNKEWWSRKLDSNVSRDRETDGYLLSLGWHVLRFWEHETAVRAADVVECWVRGRR